MCPHNILQICTYIRVLAYRVTPTEGQPYIGVAVYMGAPRYGHHYIGVPVHMDTPTWEVAYTRNERGAFKLWSTIIPIAIFEGRKTWKHIGRQHRKV